MQKCDDWLLLAIKTFGHQDEGVLSEVTVEYIVKLDHIVPYAEVKSGNKLTDSKNRIDCLSSVS